MPKDVFKIVDDLTKKVSMIAESIPEEMDEVVMGDLAPVYNKVKKKDKELARFCMGIIYSMQSQDVFTSLSLVMAYLGKEKEK